MIISPFVLLVLFFIFFITGTIVYTILRILIYKEARAYIREIAPPEYLCPECSTIMRRHGHHRKKCYGCGALIENEEHPVAIARERAERRAGKKRGRRVGT